MASGSGGYAGSSKKSMMTDAQKRFESRNKTKDDKLKNLTSYATTTNFKRETYETLTKMDLEDWEKSGAKIEKVSDFVRRFTLNDTSVIVVAAKSPGDAQRKLEAAGF